MNTAEIIRKVTKTLLLINSNKDFDTCIRSSGLPVGSHSIVGWRAQKIAASPYWISSSGWAPGVKRSLLSRITSAGIKKNQIKGILKVSYRLLLLGNVILPILGSRV